VEETDVAEDAKQFKKKLSPLFCFFNLHYKNIKMIRNSKSLLQLNHDLSEMSSKLQPLFEMSHWGIPLGQLG
jgi:hypothetical protein